MTTTTADQLARDLAAAADGAADDARVAVTVGGYAIRGAVYDTLTNIDDDSAHFAARQLDADLVAPLTVQVGYPNEIMPLAAAIEYGSATRPPGGHLTTAVEREADVAARVLIRLQRRRLR